MKNKKFSQPEPLRAVKMCVFAFIIFLNCSALFFWLNSAFGYIPFLRFFTGLVGWGMLILSIISFMYAVWGMVLGHNKQAWTSYSESCNKKPEIDEQ
jgi:hypothetical protein